MNFGCEQYHQEDDGESIDEKRVFADDYTDRLFAQENVFVNMYGQSNFDFLVKAVLCFGDFDAEEITTIDNGDYQGTQLFMIPRNTYQPSAGDYLLTFTYYGSCSGCDTLQAIQSWRDDDKVPTEEQVKDFMTLCRDLVCNITKPFNEGWREDEKFTEIAE